MQYENRTWGETTSKENASLARFKDATWFGKWQKRLLIVGAGGIGSWFAALSIRAGYDSTILDFDRVEDHNLGGQCFLTSSVGDYKVTAVRNFIDQFTQRVGYTACHTLCTKIQDWGGAIPAITIAAFDNMTAREYLFERWVKDITDASDEVKKSALFIDGRLEMEQYQIFCVKFEDIENYRKALFSDSVSDAPACTMKQTSHVAAMIAGQMLCFLNNHISNLTTGNTGHDVPFFYEYFTPITYSKTLKGDDYEGF